MVAAAATAKFLQSACDRHHMVSSSFAIQDCRLKSSSRLTGRFRALLFFALRNIERGSVYTPCAALCYAVLAGGNLISALFALVDPSRIRRLSHG